MLSFFFSILLAIGILLTYAEPVMLAVLWGRKLYRPHAGGPLWRDVALWISLSASTVAVILFWGTMLEAYRFHLGRHFHFAHYSRVSIGFAAFALVAALCGFGKARKWVIISAAIVPLSWLAAGAFE